ncbi:hypothetical protein [Magnetospirillum fulvum]|uniref:Phage protein n=1 Tax=Magnetospirillum fulvum MGU-K5 TaxID=1316936 RepID=S9TEH8_MAGFU|nr:hypothetical protein [Magnetospirillum fulvum]EPY00606.1 hypothetical protein K678_15164 [Magnetospirillum fulvum MGU-K5]
MASPLQGGIAKTIGKALAGVMLPITLNRVSGGQYDPGTGGVTPGVTKTFKAKGLVEDWGAYYLANQLVAAGDRRVSIMATTLKTTPAPGDTVTSDGQTWNVIAVQSDPAKAVWVLQVR